MEYRSLGNKESSDSKNEATVVLSVYNRSDIKKKLFVKVTRKSSDSSGHRSSKEVIRKSDQVKEGTDK